MYIIRDTNATVDATVVMQWLMLMLHKLLNTFSYTRSPCTPPTHTHKPRQFLCSSSNMDWVTRDHFSLASLPCTVITTGEGFLGPAGAGAGAPRNCTGVVLDGVGDGSVRSAEARLEDAVCSGGFVCVCESGVDKTRTAVSPGIHNANQPSSLSVCAGFRTRRQWYSYSCSNDGCKQQNHADYGQFVEVAGASVMGRPISQHCCIYHGACACQSGARAIHTVHKSIVFATTAAS